MHILTAFMEAVVAWGCAIAQAVSLQHLTTQVFLRVLRFTLSLSSHHYSTLTYASCIGWTMGLEAQFHTAIVSPHSNTKKAVVALCYVQRNYSIQVWRWRKYVSPKRWYLPTSPYGVTSQKINIKIILFVTWASESRQQQHLWKRLQTVTWSTLLSRVNVD
jgi:hypothetical protein